MPGSVVPGGEDRIGALPDDLLRRVLSLLTSRDSVCTCVLARRWHHLWRSVPVVRVMVPMPIDIEGEEEVWFVNSLLLLRDRAPLHEVHIRTYLHEPSAPLSVELWLRRRLSLSNMTLVCQHLTVLDIAGVKFEEHTLNFSSCPMLEVYVTLQFEVDKCSSSGMLSRLCDAADLKLTSAPQALIDFSQISIFLQQQSVHGKDESYKPGKQFLVSKNLKVDEIKCHKEDERIHQIVKILFSFGVPPDLIDNQQNNVRSDCK
ncbi:F-box/FBD/LRR-repeat protein [Hordeum vulgare]|nr:F-box/FBD/LRR-repeat protein [Hordeum vulgare]